MNDKCLLMCRVVCASGSQIVKRGFRDETAAALNAAATGTFYLVK